MDMQVRGLKDQYQNMPLVNIILEGFAFIFVALYIVWIFYISLINRKNLQL